MGVAPGPVRRKLTLVMVPGSIPSLKVALIFWLVGTLLARLAGLVEVTVGASVSGVAPVVKVQL